MRKAMKQFMEGFKKDERGLTLVELLAVIVILGIVGLIAFVAIGNVIENSRQDAHVANAQQIISAAELYEASGGNPTEVVGGGNITDLDTVDQDMVDPWDAEADNYLGGFTLRYTSDDDSNTGEFSIESGHANCDFVANTKEELAQKGREVCEEN